MFCGACGKKSSFRCSRCRSRRYCSRLCQEKDWPTHRANCCLRANCFVPTKKKHTGGFILEDFFEEILKTHKQEQREQKREQHQKVRENQENILLMLPASVFGPFLHIEDLQVLHSLSRSFQKKVCARLVPFCQESSWSCAFFYPAFFKPNPALPPDFIRSMTINFCRYGESLLSLPFPKFENGLNHFPKLTHLTLLVGDAYSTCDPRYSESLRAFFTLFSSLRYNYPKIKSLVWRNEYNYGNSHKQSLSNLRLFKGSFFPNLEALQWDGPCNFSSHKLELFFPHLVHLHLKSYRNDVPRFTLPATLQCFQTRGECLDVHLPPQSSITALTIGLKLDHCELFPRSLKRLQLHFEYMEFGSLNKFPDHAFHNNVLEFLDLSFVDLSMFDIRGFNIFFPYLTDLFCTKRFLSQTNQAKQMPTLKRLRLAKDYPSSFDIDRKTSIVCLSGFLLLEEVSIDCHSLDLISITVSMSHLPKLTSIYLLSLAKMEIFVDLGENTPLLKRIYSQSNHLSVSETLSEKLVDVRTGVQHHDCLRMWFPQVCSFFKFFK